MTILFKVTGKMSTFGGPADTGMSPSEGLAIFSSEQDMRNHGLADFLLSENEAGAPGLGRRLNPAKYYIACRWWETDLTKSFLKTAAATVENARTGARLVARPVDSGPAEWTQRVTDLSPGLAADLGLATDDVCTVTIEEGGREFGADFDATAESAVRRAPRIYTTEEWGARPATVSYFPRTPGVGIVIHNTEGPNRAPLTDPAAERAEAFEAARRIQSSHFRRGFSDTGQHFTVSQGGVIMEGRHGTVAAAMAGEVVRGAHSPGANDDWWGIEIAGDNQQSYVVTEPQWNAVAELCIWLTRLSGRTLRIEPHDHFRDTTCPGHIVDHLDELRMRVAAESG